MDGKLVFRNICNSSIVKPCQNSGAPGEGVPQNICSAWEIQLAGKLFIFIDFGWELPKFQVQLAGTEGNTGRLDKKLVHNNVSHMDINFHKAISAALD